MAMSNKQWNARILICWTRNVRLLHSFYGNRIVEIRIKGVVRFGFAEGITNPAK